MTESRDGKGDRNALCGRNLQRALICYFKDCGEVNKDKKGGGFPSSGKDSSV
jgi:hypothetical protein